MCNACLWRCLVVFTAFSIKYTRIKSNHLTMYSKYAIVEHTCVYLCVHTCVCVLPVLICQKNRLIFNMFVFVSNLYLSTCELLATLRTKHT